MATLYIAFPQVIKLEAVTHQAPPPAHRSPSPTHLSFYKCNLRYFQGWKQLKNYLCFNILNGIPFLKFQVATMH